MTEPTITTNNESVSDVKPPSPNRKHHTAIGRTLTYCKCGDIDLSTACADIQKELNAIDDACAQETKTLREQAEKLQFNNLVLLALKLEKEGILGSMINRLALKLEQSQAENVRLQERAEGMRSAILFAINSGVIWKRTISCECNHCKVSEMFAKALSTTPTTGRVERYRRMEAVESAAKVLVTRMREIYNDPLYRYVWESAANHGIDYSNGPKWENEFIALEKALATESDKEKV